MNSTLARRAAVGTVWVLAQQWGSRALGLVGLVVMTRLLAPTDFGLLALATVATGLVALLLEHMVITFLVQRETLERGLLETALCFAVVLGCGACLLLLVLAEPLAAVLGADAAAPVIRVLALAFPITAIGTVPSALLLRSLAFRTMAVRTLLAALGSVGVGVALALSGAGVYALAGQHLAQVVVSVTLTLVAARWRPAERPRAGLLPGMLRYTCAILAVQTLSYASRRADDLIIGLVLGPKALGYYVIAYRLLTFVLDALSSSIGAVATPVLARLRGDVPRMHRVFLRSVTASAMLALPVLTLLVVAAPVLIPAAFGQKWQASVLPSQVLAAGGLLLTLGALDRGLLLARGRVRSELGLTALLAAFSVGGFLVAAPHGITAVAAVVAVRGYLLWPVRAKALRRAGVDVRGYLAAVGRPALASSLALAAAGSAALAGAGRVAAAAAGVVALASALALLCRRPFLDLLALARTSGHGGRPSHEPSGAAGETA